MLDELLAAHRGRRVRLDLRLLALADHLLDLQVPELRHIHLVPDVRVPGPADLEQLVPRLVQRLAAGEDFGHDALGDGLCEALDVRDGHVARLVLYLPLALRKVGIQRSEGRNEGQEVG